MRDFLNYLIYVERSAENLQFFLWHRDFACRWEQAPEAERALAPEWTQAQEDELVIRMQKETAERMRRGIPAADMSRGADFEKPAMQDSFSYSVDYSTSSTPPRTSREKDQDSLYTGSHAGTNAPTNYKTLANEAYAAAGAEQPRKSRPPTRLPGLKLTAIQVTVQPYRTEIDRIVATYIADRSARQLNLSAKEQKSVLHALSQTTHPSAFRSVAASVESSLRHQAHPNFIRWSICNANPPRVAFAWGLGISLMALSTAAAVVLTLSRAPRGYRAVPAVGWVLGVATLVAGYKGLCVVLHGKHHRHVRPWELFEQDDGEAGGDEARLGAFGGGNGYEGEPWVVKYDRRNVVRKVFDREVWIREPALRGIQDTIFVQSVLVGVLVAGVLSAVFVAVPGGHFF